jgi:regulator of CtrA degradation
MGSRSHGITFWVLANINPIGSYFGWERSGIVAISTTPSAFFNKTYDETLGLLVEVRDYVMVNEPADRRRLAPVVGAKLSCEALRVTARLTQVMAWLLAQKAIHAGELSTEEVIERHDRLTDIAVCMDEEPADEVVGLPARFRELMERSHRLYIRVARLDEMIRRQLH